MIRSTAYFSDYRLIVGYFGVHRDISEQKFLEEEPANVQVMANHRDDGSGIALKRENPLVSISSISRKVVQRTNEPHVCKRKNLLVWPKSETYSKIIHDLLVDFSRPSNYQIQKPTSPNVFFRHWRSSGR